MLSSKFSNLSTNMIILSPQCNPEIFVYFSDFPSDEELALLPQIRRDQIVLTKFLGSGAFGEVFEGIAQNMFGSDSDNSRVAIKV